METTTFTAEFPHDHPTPVLRRLPGETLTDAYERAVRVFGPVTVRVLPPHEREEKIAA